MAVEGMGYVVQDLEAWWGHADRRELLPELAGTLEAEPGRLGASPYVMCVARKA